MQELGTPAVTFIVPVKDDAERLGRCLRSIRADTAGVHAQIVVVDNGSSDGSPGVARALGATVLDLPVMKVGALRNHAAALARAGVLAFVDADHEVSAGWTAAVLDRLSHPGIGAVGCAYSPPASANWVQRTYDAFRDHTPGTYPVAWLGAGNLAVRTEAFTRIGGFDPTLDACEDVELCQRLTRAGYALMHDSRMRSVHHGDPDSLARLFLGELWRGRNNLQVSLRLLTWRSLPSVLVPVAGLIALVLALLGAVVWHSMGLMVLGALTFFSLAAVRAIVLFRRLPDRRPIDAARVMVVACAYDGARALALVLRMPHRRAQYAARRAEAI